MRRSIGVVILVALFVAAQSNAQELSVGVVGRFDDNLGFARASSDIVEDISLRTDAGLNWHHQMDVRTSVDVHTGLSVEHYLRTPDFDTASLPLGVTLNRKIGLGAGLTKPQLSLEGTAGWLNSEEKFRSGLPYGVKLSARSRLQNQAIFSYRLSWSGFEPDVLYQVPMWDTQRGDAWRWQLLELGATYAMPLAERLGASLNLAYLDGDLVFSADPTPMLDSVALARAPDHALGDTFYAYRVAGEAWKSSLTLAFTPAQGQQIQLTLGRIYSRSDAGFGYDRTWLELGWTRGF